MKITFGAIVLLCALGAALNANGETLEQVNFANFGTQNVTTFSCDSVDSNGFCDSTSMQLTFPEVNATEVAISTIFAEGPMLEPRTGPRCWNNSGYECCFTPCEPNPCLNDGVCYNSTKSNESFGCTCTEGYVGEWCQLNDDTKCSNCHVNAICNGSTGTCTCKEGYEGDGTTHCTATCSSITLTNLRVKCGFENITFAKGYESRDTDSNEKCREDDRNVAKITCSATTGKFDLESLHCVPCNKTIDNLPNVTKKTTPEEVEKRLADLAVLTTGENKSPSKVEKATEYLQELADALNPEPTGNETKKLISPGAMKDVLETVENMETELVLEDEVDEVEKDDIEPEVKPSSDNKLRREHTRKLVKALDVFARSVNLSQTENKTVEITTKKTSVKITEAVKSSDGEFVDVTFEPNAYIPQENKAGQNGENGTTPTPRRAKVIMMRIPAVTVEQMSKMLNGGTMRLVFILHKDASLITPDKRTGQVIQATFKSGEVEEKTELNGQTFEIEFREPQNASSKQQDVIKGTNYDLALTYFCVYWDFGMQYWSTEGCEHKAINGSSYCVCNHLTSFALLLRVTKTLKDYKPDYYSLVACGLSALFLFLTILIYLVIRDLRVRRPTPIMVNACLNLAIAYLMFIIGMDGRQRDFSDPACYASAVIMHIAFLCAWFWMLIYSLNMYYALVKVVGTVPLVAKKVFMYLVGYGVPIIIVAIDLIVSTQLDKIPAKIDDADFESHYIASHICWLRHLSMYVGFATPVGAILFINIILFFLIIRKLTWKRREIQSSKEATTTTQQVFMAITMSTMMGLTWVFGYIMLIWDDPTYQQVLSIIFDVFNTSQGLVIFLVSCVRQKAVRDLWVMPILRCFGCEGHKKPKGAKTLASESGYTASTAMTTAQSGKSTTAL